jgi:hypothetical protein
VKPIYTSLRLHEIYHLKNLLEAAGIPCRVRNEQLCTLAGEVPFTECAAQLVLARESDREAALDVLRHWRSPRPRRPAWRCPRCNEQLEGQFTACWQCGAERQPD